MRRRLAALAAFSAIALVPNAQAAPSDPVGDLLTSLVSGTLPGTGVFNVKATLYHAGAKGVGGLEGLMARSNANADALNKIVAARPWLGHLAELHGIRSKTSVCLTVEGADEAFIKAFAALLEKEGAAYDIAGYRDAPAGLRIWCGATVETADIEALGPWLDWAYAQTKAA